MPKVSYIISFEQDEQDPFDVKDREAELKDILECEFSEDVEVVTVTAEAETKAEAEGGMTEETDDADA